MTLQLAALCFLAAAVAVGLASALAATPLPGWLVRIIELALLLIVFVWLRAVLGGVGMPDSTEDTRRHIAKVQERLDEIIAQLEYRARVHDASKLEEPEKSGFDTLTTKLADLTYGSDEYKAALHAAAPTVQHHYAHNSHHPEHYPNGIAGMSLLDVVEMLSDWKAASERVKQGSIAQSLAVNKDRFGIDAQLFSILENTVRELGW